MQKFSLVLAVMAVLSVGWVGNALAQISQGGTPPSFSLALTSVVPTVQMAPVDAAAELATDAQAPKDEAFRFAAVLDVSLNLNNSGIWEDIPDGRLWRLRISSPGAYSLCLSYDQWYIPEGGQLFVYSDDRWQVIGAFTGFNNWIDGTNITQHVAGNAIVLEYFEPSAVQGQTMLSISHVAHAYRNVFGKPDPNQLDNFGSSGSCNNNVNCPIGYNWQANKRGATMIELSNGSRLCSGSLITNVAQDQTPYYLTANHCLGGNNTWIFVFNYESPACTNVDGPTSQTVANSTLRANNSASDFALLQLSSTVPLSYAPYFNGWNNVNLAADSTIVIHHPSGDIKKISFDRNPPVNGSWSGTPANSHWRILAYESGTTEPGSSGSPLFDQNHRIIGQLHGGTASCSNNIDDYYGKFSMSWNQGSTAATRVRDWLDPANTHTVMDGYSPVSITVTAANGGESWAIGSAQTIMWTSTNLTQNVKIELNRTYPTGAWEVLSASTANSGSFPWTVAGSATTTARIRISGTTTISLNDISNANFTISSNPSPTITVTAPNGGETWLVGDVNNMTWTSANVTGNVNVELNRAYPGGAWEAIAMNTANDGTEPWTVNLPVSTTARIRVTSVVNGAVSDVSNADFTIGQRTITVTVPNGGESWIEGTAQNIAWTSTGLSENVRIEINRTFPSASWSDIVASTANTGSYPWTVSLPTSSTARIRISGTVNTAIKDTSNANFSILARTITVTTPNGGETWTVGSAQNMTWTSANVTGNVNLELNRNYPGGTWEAIASNSANDGSEPWTVTSPVSTLVRVRVTSVSFPTVSDVSNNNFTIAAGNVAPTIVHDPLDDQLVQPFVVTALVTDDVAGFVTRMFYRPVGGVNYDSLLLASTGNPNEYAVTVNGLLADQYEYFLRVLDAGGLTAVTSLSPFEIASSCGTELLYDDGSAEASHWSQTADYEWAVKFTPATFPFILCSGRLGISALHPNTSHSLLQVKVYADDGVGGLPGTVLFTKTIGSIGNVIGGVNTALDNWCDIAFRDAFGNPLSVTGNFYVSVTNPTAGVFEAFLEDQNSTPTGHSFVYDPCDLQWFSEASADNSARLGNRMIRASGFSLIPPQVVIHRAGNDIQLDWASTGAPYYKIYTATTPAGPFITLLGTTSGTSFTDVNPLGTLVKFYIVKASATP